jgi:hypothetical protein
MHQENLSMSAKDKSLIEILKEGHATKTSQHLLNVLKAGLSTAPFTGGLASLIEDYIPTSKKKRLEEFAQRVAEDLTELQAKVDENVILTDDFAHTFEECFRGAAENYQKAKLDSFRGILINSAIGTQVEESEKDFYITLVNSLSVLHLQILRFMVNPMDYLAANNIPPQSIQGGFSQSFPVAIPNVSLEAIKSAFGDLYSSGMINTDKNIFGTMTSGQGIDLIGKDGGRVSVFGRSFIQFCTSPTNQ